jgi:ribosomal protein L36
MHPDLLTAARWFSSNGLGINTDKCIAMWLSNTRDSPSYLLDSQEISTVDEIKLLGVTIDKELNFNDHVTSSVRKVSNQLQVIKRHKRLIDTNSKVKLYKAYFLPQLIVQYSGTFVGSVIP